MAEDEDAKRKQKPAAAATNTTTAATAATTTTKSRIIQLNTSSSRAGKKDIPAGLSQNTSLRSSSVQSSASARASGNNNNSNNSNSSYPDRAQGGGGNRSRPADSGNNSNSNNNNNTGNSSSSAWRSAPGSSRGGGSGGGRFGGRFYGNSGGRGSGGGGGGSGSFHNSSSNSAGGGGSSGGGGGYFKRHGSPSRGHFEGSVFHRDRTFSRGRGRSMSRSPSRSRTRSRSPRSRTRSRSPRSMSRSPRSRSRSRSRSWSPRGSRGGFSSRDHRDSGWERSSRMSGGGGGQYQDRGGGRGRGMSNFYDRNPSGGGDYYEVRGRSRDRDGDHGSAGRGSSSWSGGRGGGGGGPGGSGGRYSSFGGRGSGTSGSSGRFRDFPKDQRFSSSSAYGNDSRYGSRRSESRDRASGDMSNPSGGGGGVTSGNSNFRDRNFPRDRERDRIESRDSGTSARNSSYGPDPLRRSNSTASRKNDLSGGHGEDRRSEGGDRPGERKKDERDNEQQEREKNRAGSDRDSATSGLDTKAKRDLLLSARTLPPRPSFHFNSTGSAGGSRASTPKESQDVREDSNDEKSLLSKEVLTSKLSAIGEIAEREEKQDAEIAITSEKKPGADEVQEDTVMEQHDAESEPKRDVDSEHLSLSADVSSTAETLNDETTDREAAEAPAVSPEPADLRIKDIPVVDDKVLKDEDVVMESSSIRNDTKLDPERDVARSESEPVRQSSNEDIVSEGPEAVQSDDIEMVDDAAVEEMEDVEEKISEAADAAMPESDGSSVSTQLREEGTGREKEAKALTTAVPDQPALSPTADTSPPKTTAISDKSTHPITFSKDESSASTIAQSAKLMPSRSEKQADEVVAKPVQYKEEKDAQIASIVVHSENAEGKLSPVKNAPILEEGEATSLVEVATASETAEVPVAAEVSPKKHAEPRRSQETDKMELQAASEDGKADTSSGDNANSKVVETLTVTKVKAQTVQEKSVSVSDSEEKSGNVKEKAKVVVAKAKSLESSEKQLAVSGAADSLPATVQAKQEPESHTSPSPQKTLIPDAESKKGELVGDQASSSKMSSSTGASSKVDKQRSDNSTEVTQSNVTPAASVSSKKPAVSSERERGWQESGRRLSITEEKGGHASGSHALLPDRSDTKPRASSFSSSNVPSSSVGASQRDGVPHGERGLQRTYSASSNFIHQEKRDGDYRHRAMLSDQKRNSPQKVRPNLERHGSFSSERGERTPPLLSKTRSVPGMSLTGVSSSRLSSTTSHGSPIQVSHDSSSEQRKRVWRDEARGSETVKTESRIPLSNTDSDKLKSIKGPVGRSSPQPTSHSSHAPKSTEPESPRDELPALPEIPLPSGVLRPPSQQDDAGSDFGTPTKQPKRPRLGWGQGLVASSPPPQPPKRPRIGWGEGLMQQAVVSSPTSSVVSSSAETTATATTGNDDGGEEKAEKLDEAMPAVEAAIAEDAQMEEPEVIATSEDAQPESQPDVPSQPKADPVDSSNVADKTPEAVVEVKDEPAVPAKPSKEEILSSIDELDSTIASVKKHIKLLQSVIKEAESAPDTSLTSDASEDQIMEPVTADQQNGDKVGDEDKNELSSASATKEENIKVPEPVSQPPAPVKIAVDPAFIQLVANVFSENARKAIIANDKVPKRTFNDEVVTTIYREPSDYPFYQENLDRGMGLRDSIRLKVRTRNRLRHEHLKKLAREYVDLKKMWKLRVKKMEKDRKRQEKLRTKQQQKLKAKQKNALASGDPSAQAAGLNASQTNATTSQILGSGSIGSGGSDSAGIGGSNPGIGGIRTSSRLTNNSSADLQSKSELEKLEQAKAQALVDQEIRKKRLKNALTTIVPDMIVTIEERKTRYFLRNGKGQGCMTNGIVSDWKKREKAEMHVNPWNDLEKCIYIDKFLQYPKNFARISSFLSNKNTGDVIAFYYRTKKVVDYKALLREQQLRRRGTGSKNTWSCWNLSACASICLGVKFPEHIARLLLHPSNFRSHQASDNIINSPGAQLLLRSSAKKGENAFASTGSSGITAVTLISAAEGGAPSGAAANAEVSETKKLAFEEGASERQLLDLYSQKLSQFVTGQQQPFLVNFAEFLSDNSYSTGYEVSTLSVAERLKRYRIPAEPKSVEKIENVAEKTSATSSRTASTDRAQEGASKVKSQPGAASGHNSTAKNGNGAPSATLTKKELKQQRRLKKVQEQPASQSPAVASASAATPSSTSGGVSALGSNQMAPSGRKKPMPPTPTVSAAAANRNSPRVIGEEKEKSAPTTKKNSKSSNATPGSRRNSGAQSAPSVSSPKVQPPPLPAVLTPSPVIIEQGPIVPPLEPSVLTIAPISTPASGPAVPVPGSAHPAGTPSGASGSASAPVKRVVQKWTEAEKADFLKFFSLHGKDWATLTDSIPTKTAAQIKNYYQNYKNRLGLQEILKRRIESSSGSSAAGGSASTPSIGMPSSVASPSDDLQPAALTHMSLPSSSTMSMGGHDSTSSLHGSHAIPASMQNIVTQVDMTTPSLAMMQAHGAGQQQSSRDVMGGASNSERYFKLLNMQHHLQMMHMQQQTPQGMAGESGGPGSPYHDGQMKTPGGSRLMQYSRHPGSHAMSQPQAHHHSAQQHLSLQHSLHQAVAHGHPQGHPQTVHGAHPHAMQMQMQQGRSSYGEMPHPGMYHPMTQVHAHPHAAAAAAAATQLGLASGAGRPYGLMDPSGAEISSARNDGSNPPVNLMAGGANMLSQRDISSRAMLNLAMMSGATGSGGVMNTLSSQPNMKTSPVQQMAVQNADVTRHDASGHSTMYQLGPGMASRGSARVGEPGTPAVDSVKNEASGSGVQESQPMGYQGEGADSQRRTTAPSPPKPTVRIPPSSRMSFSSILNDSNDSPRTVMTPRGAAQLGSSMSQMQHRQDSPHHVHHRPSGLPPPVPSDNVNQSPIAQSPTAHLLPRRGSSTGSRMGLMSNLLNVASPERSPSHHSPMMQQQHQHVQSGRYYDVTGASQSNQHVEREGTSSRVSIGAVLNSSSNHRDEDDIKPTVPNHSTSAQATGLDRLERGFTRNVSQQNVMSSSDGRVASVSEAASSTSSGSVQTTTSSSNRGPTPPVPSPPHQQAQEMAWSYQHHMRYEEEAELLRRAAMEKERLARRAEEEAARAAAAAAAAARALQEAQQARQEAMDMAANVARFSSAIHQQHQLHHPQYQQQQQQLQSQHQQMQQQMQQQQQQQMQQQQQQQYSTQVQHHQQQQQQQQEYQHHQQLQQQQQLQHQALHHHLQMMQQQHQHQQRATGIPPTLERDNSGGSHHHLMQQQQQQQQHQQQQQQQQQQPGPSER